MQKPTRPIIPRASRGEKLWPVRLQLPLTAEIVARLDALKTDDETRLDVIRAAISAEIARRS